MAGPKPKKTRDSAAFFLLVEPSGGKLWRMKYRIDGREKKLAIGRYPEIGLAEARRRRDAAREQLAQGKARHAKSSVIRPVRGWMPRIPLLPWLPSSGRSAGMMVRGHGHPQRRNAANTYSRYSTARLAIFRLQTSSLLTS
jgi:hypothetical protein